MCDEFRDQRLPGLGVLLEDRDGHTVVKYVGKDVASKDKEKKAQELAEKEKLKEEMKRKQEDAKVCQKVLLQVLLSFSVGSMHVRLLQLCHQKTCSETRVRNTVSLMTKVSPLTMHRENLSLKVREKNYVSNGKYKRKNIENICQKTSHDVNFLAMINLMISFVPVMIFEINNKYNLAFNNVPSRIWWTLVSLMNCWTGKSFRYP